MGMSTHVVGIKPPDDTWREMKAVWDACHMVNVPVPREVVSYFNGEPPDPQGVLVEVVAVPWQDDAAQGVEVYLPSLPPHVTALRFYNAW